MAQNKKKPADKQASKLVNKVQIRLSNEAVDCLTVACLFRNTTMGDIVDKLIRGNLAEFAPMRGATQFGVSADLSTNNESAMQANHNNSPSASGN